MGRINGTKAAMSAAFSSWDQPGNSSSRSSRLRRASLAAVIRVCGEGTIICAEGCARQRERLMFQPLRVSVVVNISVSMFSQNRGEAIQLYRVKLMRNDCARNCPSSFTTPDWRFAFGSFVFNLLLQVAPGSSKALRRARRTSGVKVEDGSCAFACDVSAAFGFGDIDCIDIGGRYDRATDNFTFLVVFSER